MAKIYAIELPVLKMGNNLKNKLSAVRAKDDVRIFSCFRYEEVIILNIEGVLQFHQRSQASVYLDCNCTYFFKPQFLSTQKGRCTSGVARP